METEVNIGAYKKRFQGRLGRFKKGVLIKLFGAVIRDTPVLTGRLRANWQFTVNSPPESATTLIDPSGATTMTKVTAQVQGQVTDKDAAYLLTNNLSYVIPIEYHGHSKVKAPEGMVRRNIIRIAALLKAQASL